MRKAFTLIELLVVVSIIALLIASLLPVLSSTRYAAKLTRCAITLKGISGVQLAHATDSDGFFPTAGYRYGSQPGENQSWFQAQSLGAQVKSWELRRPGRWDLIPVYEDYMQRYEDIDSVLNCPLASEAFKQDNDNEISYMIYTTNNYRIKTNNYHEVGGHETMDKTFSPRAHPDQDFAVLASDFAYGRASGYSDPSDNTSTPVTGALTTHPALKGALGERGDANSEVNDARGFIIGDSQNAPMNYADIDGSVRQFKINANSYLDTDNWLPNFHSNSGGFGFMLPRDLAK